MGPSLIILLIIVVWVIVLAPLVLGNNKPIRRAGEGYEETRVLHEGGTAPVAGRRRPKLTAADVHRYAPDDGEFEVVEAVADDEPVLIDDTEKGLSPIFRRRGGAGGTESAESAESAELVKADANLPQGADAPGADEHRGGSHIVIAAGTDAGAGADAGADADAGVDADAGAAAANEEGGSTAYSVLRARSEAGENERAGEAEYYEAEESYLAPADFGFADAEPAGGERAEGGAEDAEDVEDVENTDGADADTGSAGDAQRAAGPAEGGEDARDAGELAEPSEEDIAFAESRRGRGGYDPQRDARNRADRYKRRQRTFAGLLVACVITLAAAVLRGGWVWVLPAISIGLTVWFLVALRQLVKKERALRQRRMRQLRRARLGVDTAERPLAQERRRAGAVILDADDASPDFDHLPRYSQPEPEHGFDPSTDRGPRGEVDDYPDYGGRAS